MEEIRQKLKVYRALDNDYRVNILVALFHEPNMAFNDLARSLGIERGLLAYHLGVLKHIGLIKGEYERKSKKSSKYYLTNEGMKMLKELELIGKPVQECNRAEGAC